MPERKDSDAHGEHWEFSLKDLMDVEKLGEFLQESRDMNGVALSPTTPFQLAIICTQWPDELEAIEKSGLPNLPADIQAGFTLGDIAVSGIATCALLLTVLSEKGDIPEEAFEASVDKLAGAFQEVISQSQIIGSIAKERADLFGGMFGNN